MRYGSAQLEGFNTESSERAQIGHGLVKNPHRTSNKKDYFKQMTDFLTRQEQVVIFSSYVNWILDTDKDSARIWSPSSTFNSNGDEEPDSEQPAIVSRRRRVSTRQQVLMSSRYFLPVSPSKKQIDVPSLVADHGAVDFMACLKTFLYHVDTNAATFPIEQDHFDIYKRLTIVSKPLNGIDEEEIRDVVRATPRDRDKANGNDYFDTVLVHEDEGAVSVGIAVYRVAQIRVIFRLPGHLRTYQKPLAYIEYFTPFTNQHQGTDLYAVHRSIKNGKREAAVISLDSITCSCHLIPIFGSRVNPEWTFANVLEKCKSFYVNPYISREYFQMSLG